MIREEEIINDVVYNLKRLTNLKDIDFKIGGPGYDYDFMINGTTFACEVKRQVSKANYNLVVQQMRRLKEQTNKPLMVVAQHFVPELFDKFPNEGISIVESNGNCMISEPPLFIYITGQKSTIPREMKGNAFNEAGLKVIFYFLLDEANISKPYRVISKETGLSLGTINNVMEELQRNQFVFSTPQRRILKNKRGLLDLWQTHYNQKLKPKLMIKEMDFVDSESWENWERIILPEGMYWGGEGGAYILNHYMIPEQFDIYTETPSIKLMMTKKVRFQENGRIKLYQKFWKGIWHEKVAPKILVYADLLGSGNSRCIEAAKKLVENGI